MPRRASYNAGMHVLAVITDLMVQSRVAEQAKRRGWEVSFADTPGRLRDALAAHEGPVVVDLHAQGVDWREAVRLAKERSLPLLAFGRHTEASLLREACDAGCDRVVPRSTFVEEMPALIEELAAAPG